jgi:phosphatidylinositol glycan class W
MATLKEQKEAFVTGHNGTTPLEVLLVCMSAPLGVLLFQTVPKSIPKWQKVTIEALCLLFVMAICQTSFLYPWGTAVLCLEGIIGSTWWIRHRAALKEISSTDFVSAYRSTIMVLTFVAILAVDFQVFPRRYAKTETQGYGLMDLGAGSFVAAAGLVSPRSRGKAPPAVVTSLKRMVPLLTLGFIRLLTTKGLEYQEHVSEYGVHWNFFFTLAAMEPLAAAYPSGWLIPCMLMGLYQFSLSNYKLQEFIETAPRKCWEGDPFSCNFIAANREGIVGIVGYLVVFLLSEHIGTVCIWTKTGVCRGKWLYGASGLLWTLLAVLTQFCNVPVSRRSTNASFCAWTLAHNTLILASLWTVTETVPPIFQAMNRHGLLVFVVANLLTGLTNLTINTLEASNFEAILVVFAYLCVVGCFSLICDKILPSKSSSTGQHKEE